MAIYQIPQRRNLAGSGFTNLQRILQASKGGQLGQAVSSGVQKAGEAARGALQKAGTEFQQQVGAEQQRQAAEEQRAKTVLGDVTKASEEDIKAFQGIRGGLSQGPSGLTGAEELQRQAQEAQQLGQATGSEVGRLGLLQRFVGGGQRYTGGQQSLDALLLGQLPTQLRQSRRGTFGMGQKAETQQIASQEVAKQLASKAKGLAQSTIGQLGEQAIKFDVGMEQKRQQEQENLAKYQEDIRKQLESGTVSQDVINKLGLQEGAQLWGLDLSKFYRPQNIIATKENVMNEADLARIEALRKLSGQSLTGEASAVLGQYTDASKVGEFQKPSKFEIEQEALKDALSRQQSAYKEAISPAEEQIRQQNLRLYGVPDYDPLSSRGVGVSFFDVGYAGHAGTLREIANKIKYGSEFAREYGTASRGYEGLTPEQVEAKYGVKAVTEQEAVDLAKKIQGAYKAPRGFEQQGRFDISKLPEEITSLSKEAQRQGISQGLPSKYEQALRLFTQQGAGQATGLSHLENYLNALASRTAQEKAIEAQKQKYGFAKTLKVLK